MAVLLILVSTLTHLAESLFIKRYNTKHARGGFLFTAFVSFFSMLVFLVTDKNGFFLPSGIWLYAIAAGILYCSASFLTYVALQIGSYAMSMLILSYSIVLSIGYGLIFLGEPISVFTCLGFGMMLLSIYFVRAPKKEGDDKKISFKWVVCIAIAALGSGLFGVVQRMQQLAFNNACTNEFMVIALAFSFCVLFAIGMKKDGADLKYVLRHGVPWTAAAGVSNGLTNAMVVFLYTLMPISLSSPIRVGVKIIFSFALSVLIFREKFEKRQVVGVLCGTVALVLLNIK
ncbi:MAG: EamA family transporter [Clostridia bacterium]|nr:EamA family transporter [Clostridia bacterium]